MRLLPANCIRNFELFLGKTHLTHSLVSRVLVKWETQRRRRTQARPFSWRQSSDERITDGVRFHVARDPVTALPIVTAIPEQITRRPSISRPRRKPRPRLTRSPSIRRWRSPRSACRAGPRAVPATIKPSRRSAAPVPRPRRSPNDAPHVRHGGDVCWSRE